MADEFEGHNVDGRSFRWARTREAAHRCQVLELHNMNQFSSLRCLWSYMCDTPIAPIFMTSEFKHQSTAWDNGPASGDLLYIVSPTHRPNNVCLP